MDIARDVPHWQNIIGGKLYCYLLLPLPQTAQTTISSEDSSEVSNAK